MPIVHTRWDQGCPHRIPTFAWHVPACASNRVGPHSRVDTCPPPFPPPPGASPIHPFPVSRIKTHVDPVVVPSSAPSLLLLIPSFSLLRLLSNGTFSHSLPPHILFYFIPLPWPYQIAKIFATLFFSYSRATGYTYIYTYRYIYTHT